jgi:hypothetical protein
MGGNLRVVQELVQGHTNINNKLRNKTWKPGPLTPNLLSSAILFSCGILKDAEVTQM